MLLIDGVRYEEWAPEHEVEEFQPIIEEHFQEIFGKHSFIFEASSLKSEAGLGSKPDWFIISFEQKPEWYIVEAELSSHDLYEHIVDQIGRFINGIKNVPIQKKVIEALYHEITGEKVRKAEIEELIGSGEIYKYLSDLISRPPTLAIIIERRTPELKEALELLKYSPIEVVEFKTFKRAGAGAVHAHLFEPLHKPAPPPPPPSAGRPLSTKGFELVLKPSNMKYYYIHIPIIWQDLFPKAETTLQLETNLGVIPVGLYIDPKWGASLQRGLNVWFKQHPALRPGDKVRVGVVEPMKRYRLEIVK